MTAASDAAAAKDAAKDKGAGDLKGKAGAADANGSAAAAAAALDGVNVLDFFKEELQCEDQLVRLEAVKRVKMVAHFLGPKRSTEELIPFLHETSQEGSFLNDDEILFRLAEQYTIPECFSESVLTTSGLPFARS